MTVRDKRYISNHVVKSYFLREERMIPPSRSFNNPSGYLLKRMFTLDTPSLTMTLDNGKRARDWSSLLLCVCVCPQTKPQTSFNEPLRRRYRIWIQGRGRQRSSNVTPRRSSKSSWIRYITCVLDDNNNTRDPVSHRFSSVPRRTRSRNVSYLWVKNKGSPVRDGEGWRGGGWKKEDNEGEKEGKRERERERYRFQVADVTEFLSTSIEHRAQRVGHYCRGTS